jgi:hypothetical protein
MGKNYLFCSILDEEIDKKKALEIEERKKRLIICKEHNERVKYFCEEDNEYLCRDCDVDKHFEHYKKLLKITSEQIFKKFQEKHE